VRKKTCLRDVGPVSSPSPWEVPETRSRLRGDTEVSGERGEFVTKEDMTSELKKEGRDVY
jgi:hypothetical protein